MSSEIAWLSLRLEGPLQSWGFDSQYNRRNTSLMPTKSAIAGMCCAALGLPRGSDQEEQFLLLFASLKMTTIAIPRRVRERPLDVHRLQDYHTVLNTKTADGKTKNCHITHRQYLTDSGFGIILFGNADRLRGIARALFDPRWGIWLGRKTCIPTSPVLAGVFVTQEEALHSLIGDLPIDAFTRQEEVGKFADGKDSLPDQVVSFKSEKREFAPRRVNTVSGKATKKS
jgi:CRISPR system Cascade subunit CasD